MLRSYKWDWVWDGCGLRSLCGAIVWAPLCGANKLVKVAKTSPSGFEILRCSPSQASFLLACTGDASDPVCLSHFLDAISHVKGCSRRCLHLLSFFSKRELSSLAWPWVNKPATEGGLTGKGGWGVFGWVCCGKAVRCLGPDFISTSVSSKHPRQRRCGVEYRGVKPQLLLFWCTN